MAGTDYAAAYRDRDFRKHPEEYKIGRGEQGLLIAEPYKSEILPYWKFKTPAEAEASARKIYQMFQEYKKADDFVGMDMSRKFLQMGFTRSRRYANHSSGRKYDVNKTVLKQEDDWADSEKAESARIFYGYYEKAKDDPDYVMAKAEHRRLHG